MKLNYITFRVQYINDLDVFKINRLLYPIRPPSFMFNTRIPLSSQVAAVLRQLEAPHRVSDIALQIHKNGEFQTYLDLDQSIDEQEEEFIDFDKSSRNSVVVRTSLSVRCGQIIEQLKRSCDKELRRFLIVLKDVFQEDKDIVYHFVNFDGLNCLVNIGKSDTKFQTATIRALGEIMVYVDGMQGVMDHGNTIQWLYSLLGSSESGLVLRAALKLLLVFVEYHISNCVRFVEAIHRVDTQLENVPWRGFLLILSNELIDSEIKTFAMSLINNTLNGLEDTDVFYDQVDSMDKQNMEQLTRRYTMSPNIDPKLQKQFELYEMALKIEDGEMEPNSTAQAVSTLRRRKQDAGSKPKRKSQRYSLVLNHEDANNLLDVEPPARSGRRSDTFLPHIRENCDSYQPQPLPGLSSILSKSSEKDDSLFIGLRNKWLKLRKKSHTNENSESRNGLLETSFFTAEDCQPDTDKKRSHSISGQSNDNVNHRQTKCDGDMVLDENGDHRGSAENSTVNVENLRNIFTRSTTQEKSVTTRAFVQKKDVGQYTEKYSSLFDEKGPNWSEITEESTISLKFSDFDFCDLTLSEYLSNNSRCCAKFCHNKHSVLHNSVSTAVLSKPPLLPPVLLPPPLPSSLGLSPKKLSVQRTQTVPSQSFKMHNGHVAKNDPSANDNMSDEGAVDEVSDRSRKTVRLFWKTINFDTKDEHVWGQLPNVQLDKDKLTDLFTIRSKELNKKFIENKPVAKAVSVLSNKRSNAITISLTKLPPISAVKLAIIKMDHSVIGKEGLEKILTLLPTDEEMTAINEALMENPDGMLETAEEFLHMLSSIPQLNSRLQIWKFKLNFDSIEKEIGEHLMDLKDSIDVLKNNVTFKWILSVLLEMGNHLNTSQVNGFDLEFLSRVPTVKDTDKKHSLLYHMADIIMSQFTKSTDFYSEIGAVSRASRYDYAEIDTIMSRLQKDCSEACKNLRGLCADSMNMLSDTSTLQGELAAFLARAAHRIVTMKVIYDRIKSRYACFLLWLGIPTHEHANITPNQFFSTISVFALEYRTTRAKILLEKEKNEKRNQRLKTRGKFIFEKGNTENSTSAKVNGVHDADMSTQGTNDQLARLLKHRQEIELNGTNGVQTVDESASCTIDTVLDHLANSATHESVSRIRGRRNFKRLASNRKSLRSRNRTREVVAL